MVLHSIDKFFECLELLQLKVSIRAANELVPIRAELASCAQDATLSKAQAGRINSILKDITATIIAESDGMFAYIISERRIPIERLLRGMGDLFAKDVFNQLPDLAKQDFSEAGRCLAFERPTAAAFHMLRGGESTLREYYCKKLHRNRAQLMWGPMVQSMRAYPKRFPLTLLNHLDHIRSGFRNPTAHPEKTYDMDEAQDLFSICIDVSNRMVQDLNSSAKKSG
jgi:hypothetical protein